MTGWLRRLVATRAAFYVGVPLLLAVAYTLFRSGASALMPLPSALLFWTLLMFASWWAALLVAAVAHTILKPWSPPLWLLCLIGSFGQALILSPAYRMIYRWAQDELMTGGHIYRTLPLPAFTWDYIAVLLEAVAPGAIIFIGLNYLYDRVLGLPRLRYSEPAHGSAAASVEPPATAADAPSGPAAVGTAPTDAVPPESAPGSTQTSPPSPQFLQSSRLPETAQIFALTAEEHYVRIHADAGTDLVRYRFSDALDELAGLPGGMQVHRSWWVRTDCVVGWQLRGRSLELTLPGELRVPVSLAYREAVLAHAPTDVRSTARPNRGAVSVEPAIDTRPRLDATRST